MEWVPATLAKATGLGGLAGLALLVTTGLGAEADTQADLKRLRQQNELLQHQLNEQQKLIEELSRRVSEISQAHQAQPAQPEKPDRETWFSLDRPLRAIHLGIEGGVGFFDTESEGKFPNHEFRVDEAKVFLEAPVWKSVYFFSELNITTREEQNEDLRVGELYLELEHLSRLWNQDHQLNLRVGRFDIPFGEEYLTRDAIDNPLISHSLSDLWGVDEGVQLFGRFGPVSYAVAVQNGGHPSLRDYNSDKSVAGRLGYDPWPWLHLSASAMRTGELDQRDKFSELWFGNGLIRSVGSTNATTFQAELFEGDVRVQWSKGHVQAGGGYLHYYDNDTPASNRRDVYYYYLEGLHYLTEKFYGAARWSQIFADKGFPLLGHGEYNRFFRNSLSTDLWRLSLGLGYRWSHNLVLKAEYTFEKGKLLGGAPRTHENFVAAELAFKF